MRASLSRCPATIGSDAIAAVSLKSVAAEKSRCISSSDGIAGLHDLAGSGRFIEQDLEGWKIGIPFDQRRLGAEMFDGGAIQVPYGRRYPRAMCVDQARTAGVEPREVDFRDRIARHGRQVRQWIEAVVDRIDVNVVDVEQQLATGAPGNGGDEFPFGHRVVGKAQVR